MANLIIKHLPGRHDQHRHAGKRQYGNMSASIGGAGNAKLPEYADIDALSKKLSELDSIGDVDTGQMLRDPDVRRILDDGKFMDGSDAVQNHMTDGECHWNVSELYEQGKLDYIVLGYSKNSVTKDWIQHTWGLRDGKVVETTPSNSGNESYYGVALDAVEARIFVGWTSNNSPGGGVVRRVSGWG